MRLFYIFILLAIALAANNPYSTDDADNISTHHPHPTWNPSHMPTWNPSHMPTWNPSHMPTHHPHPTWNPSHMPTHHPHPTTHPICCRRKPAEQSKEGEQRLV